MNNLEQKKETIAASPTEKIWEYSLPNNGLNLSSRPFISGAPEHLQVRLDKIESDEKINYAITVEGEPREGDSFSFTPDIPGQGHPVVNWTFEGGKWISEEWEESLEEEQNPE